ncbi:DUF167 domain-containing protein [Sphingosinicella rhizophila]|uniref:UPF0235 protein RQX22_02340 n=1 Tax=Sphingosinicella rhizophila TaxID=3050082 RepID=A0ABU3Q305_9SPHN|nr:DUF167 domain-containing protein [Sphingosinicella sp. GR2756]MDT9597787.1 DUF167 domain-containing protein [Sphingosinicella sp. GR2756]
MDKPYRRVGSRVRLAVRVTPRAGRNAVSGVSVDAGGKSALAIRLAAAPREGAANDGLVDFIAKALRLPRSAIKIESGAKSRHKSLYLAGDPDMILDRLANWTSPVLRNEDDERKA